MIGQDFIISGWDFHDEKSRFLYSFLVILIRKRRHKMSLWFRYLDFGDNLKISTCPHENLNLLSWKSQPVIIKSRPQPRLHCIYFLQAEMGKRGRWKMFWNSSGDTRLSRLVIMKIWTCYHEISTVHIKTRPVIMKINLTLGPNGLP